LKHAGTSQSGSQQVGQKSIDLQKLNLLQCRRTKLTGTGGSLIGEKRERWQELCEQASVEQDSQRLLEIVAEINRLFEEKRKRLDLEDKAKATS
jgi:hypothetical protein